MGDPDGSMGKFKFLVTLAPKEDMHETLSVGKDILDFVFDDIRVWTPEELGETRRVWINCYGTPLHGYGLIRI